MFIEVFTTTTPLTHGYFEFKNRYVMDDMEVGIKKIEYQINAKQSETTSFADILYNEEWLYLFADTVNLGTVCNDIIKDDYKFGIKKKHTNLNEFQRLKKNQPRQWIEYQSGEKRFAAIYTRNVETYRNIKYSASIPNYYLTKCFRRVVELQNNFFISLQFDGILEAFN